MKIYIIGTSGCGKSTVAKQLTKKLAYPHIELDHYRFLAGWQKRNENDFINIVKEKTKTSAECVAILVKDLRPPWCKSTPIARQLISRDRPRHAQLRYLRITSYRVLK